MKPITLAVCALTAFAVLTPLPATAKDHDDDKHHHDKDHDKDHDRDHDNHRRRPWFGFWPSRTTVIYDESPRYYAPYRSIEVEVQRALARRGYYHGPIDGDIGFGTMRAIRAYQYDNDLPVSGRIDRYLLRSLGL